MGENGVPNGSRRPTLAEFQSALTEIRETLRELHKSYAHIDKAVVKIDTILDMESKTSKAIHDRLESEIERVESELRDSDGTISGRIYAIATGAAAACGALFYMLYDQWMVIGEIGELRARIIELESTVIELSCIANIQSVGC